MATFGNRTVLAGIVVALFVAVNSPAEEQEEIGLQIGDPAPVFECKDDQGHNWKSSDRFCVEYTVVYFYPGDFTCDCTKQAESFRDNLQALADRCVEVVGVSGDTVETHRLFKELYGLEFGLLSDADGRVAKQFGVPFQKGGKARARYPDGKVYFQQGTRKSLIVSRGGTARRQTFIIGPEGRIVYKNTDVDPVNESRQVLELIASLQEKRS